MAREAADATGRNPMADLIGPTHTGHWVANLLGCRVGDLPDLVARGDLIGMQTADGVWVYPAFQFTAAGAVRIDLLPVLRHFTGHSGWSVSVWLQTPLDELDDATPEAWLTAGRDHELVHRLGARAASRWAE